MFALLVGLCFMIKCKLDSDNATSAAIQTKQEVDSKKSQAASAQESDQQLLAAKAKQDSIIAAKKDILEEQKRKKQESKEKLALKEKAAAKKKAAQKQTKKKTTKKKTPVKKTAPKPRAKIEFEEMKWDFGKLTAGDIVKKKFKFTNTGNAPLQILGATATCGCTTPTVPFLDIAPGESNNIGVTYNSVSKEGDQFPELTIESNTFPKYTVIKITGHVTPKEKEKPKQEVAAKSVDSTTTKQDTTVRQ